MTATVSASVAGSWINGAAVVTGGANHQVINPANGDVVAELALATPADVDAAVAAARTALPGWAGATPADRSDGAGQAGGADCRARRRAGRRGGQPDRQARAAGPRVRRAGQHRQHRLLRRRGPPPRGQGHRGVLRRPHLQHPARGRRGGRDASRRGTTRCRWRCGRCCPPWPRDAASSSNPRS